MARIAQLDIKVGVDGSGVGAGLRTAIGQISTAQQSSMARLGGGLRSAGGQMTQAGAVMTGAITLPLIGVGAAATTMANDFNRDMANVASLIPGTGSRILQLKRDVQDVAMATGVATKDIAGGLYQVISAFGDTAQTSQQLNINVRAAAAGLATTSDAINLTSAVTKAYGDTSAAAIQKAADLSLLTVRLGQTTFPELAASIGRVTPMAKTMGMSQESLFAVMATASGRGDRWSKVPRMVRMAKAAPMTSCASTTP
jgi:hypothetical protein